MTNGPPVVIVYFSETGTAHALADCLRRRLLRFHFPARVVDASETGLIASLLFSGISHGHDHHHANDNHNDKTRPVVVFLCATTGNGEIPRHARRLWKFMLRRKLAAGACAGLQFSTFGLGDSAYARFNWAGKKVHARLLQLGGTEVCKRGEGDESASDSGGVEGAYAAWEATFIDALLVQSPLPAGVDPIARYAVLPPENPVVVMPDRMIDAGQLDTRVTSTIRLGKIKTNTRITPVEHFQDVREFVLETDSDSDGAGVKFSESDIVPGSTVAIYPSNHATSVQALISSQGWDDVADNLVAVPPAVQQWATSQPLTLRSLITHHVDLTSVPRASFFEVLSYFSAGNDQQKEKLQEFADASNQEFTQDRYDYADRPRRSALECLTEFESVRLPVEYLLEAFPRLTPRQFSIAGRTDNGEIELLVAIVKYRTVLRRIRHGVCTRYLAALKPGDKLLYEIQPPSVPLPGPQVPVVLVGPGTGVAPLRFLIRQRMATVGKTVLIFGNRHVEADFYYRQEWKQITGADEVITDNGILSMDHNNSSNKNEPGTQVHAVFSRDENKYRYVQDALRTTKIADTVTGIILSGGSVWVCGSKGKMPKAVRAAIEESLDRLGHDGKSIIASMDKAGRYVEETW
ncbi:hypothetical protein V1514DRAFT_330639 [Lipomyces japonicus]|uniref:uncharacterized protein n=1 Tax=Lipomyces japonicus TaxID=56871 RepID=UPI0034CF2B49